MIIFADQSGVFSAISRWFRVLSARETTGPIFTRLLIADRLVLYAGLVGKENVIAGTDCGIGSRVWNGEIAWAKFSAMAEGARIATRELWK